MKSHFNLCRFAVNSRYGYALATSLCRATYMLVYLLAMMTFIIGLIAVTTWGLVSIPWIANFNEIISEKIRGADGLFQLLPGNLAMHFAFGILLMIIFFVPIIWLISMSAEDTKISKIKILKAIMPLSLGLYFMLWPTLGWGAVAIGILVILVRLAVTFGFEAPNPLPDPFGRLEYSYKDPTDRVKLLKSPPIWVFPLWMYYQLIIANSAKRFKEIFPEASSCLAGTCFAGDIQKAIDQELTSRAEQAIDQASRRAFWKAHDTAWEMGFRVQGKIGRYPITTRVETTQPTTKGREGKVWLLGIFLMAVAIASGVVYHHKVARDRTLAMEVLLSGVNTSDSARTTDSLIAVFSPKQREIIRQLLKIQQIKQEEWMSENNRIFFSVIDDANSPMSFISWTMGSRENFSGLPKDRRPDLRPPSLYRYPYRYIEDFKFFEDRFSSSIEWYPGNENIYFRLHIILPTSRGCETIALVKGTPDFWKSNLPLDDSLIVQSYFPKYFKGDPDFKGLVAKTCRHLLRLSENSRKRSR